MLFVKRLLLSIALTCVLALVVGFGAGAVAHAGHPLIALAIVAVCYVAGIIWACVYLINTLIEMKAKR
jgi:hypothetical protein